MLPGMPLSFPILCISSRDDISVSVKFQSEICICTVLQALVIMTSPRVGNVNVLTMLPLPCPLTSPFSMLVFEIYGSKRMSTICHTLNLCDWSWISHTGIFVTRDSMCKIKDMETWDDEDYKICFFRRHTMIITPDSDPDDLSAILPNSDNS